MRKNVLSAVHGQVNSNPGSESSNWKGRRVAAQLPHKMIVAGAAAATGFPYISARAAENPAIKFGLLEDRSGNFSIFGINKWHGLSRDQRDQRGLDLEGGVQGPGGPGVFAKVAAKPLRRTSRKQLSRRRRNRRGYGLNEEDEYLVKSAKTACWAPDRARSPDPQSDNTIPGALAKAHSRRKG